MSTEHEDPGHGHSPAAWTSVIIMLAAFVIGTVAFFLDVQWLVWASAALLLIGLVVGWVLARVGYGVGGAKVAERAH
jgi:hydrogenase-4 membrane subunit HyfE